MRSVFVETRIATFQESSSDFRLLGQKDHSSSYLYPKLCPHRLVSRCAALLVQTRLSLPSSCTVPANAFARSEQVHDTPHDDAWSEPCGRPSYAPGLRSTRADMCAAIVSRNYLARRGALPYSQTEQTHTRVATKAHLPRATQSGSDLNRPGRGVSNFPRGYANILPTQKHATRYTLTGNLSGSQMCSVCIMSRCSYPELTSPAG
jgi:hypothetical protein